MMTHHWWALMSSLDISKKKTKNNCFLCFFSCFTLFRHSQKLKWCNMIWSKNSTSHSSLTIGKQPTPVSRRTVLIWPMFWVSSIQCNEKIALWCDCFLLAIIFGWWCFVTEEIVCPCDRGPGKTCTGVAGGKQPISLIHNLQSYV